MSDAASRLRDAQIEAAGHLVWTDCTEGPGDPVLMFHSSGSTGRQWRLLQHMMRGKRPSMAPDLLGSGRNAPWPRDRPVDVEQDVEVALDLLGRLEGPVTLVGHSYGGWLALRVALRRPDRVARVVLHEPVLWGILFAAGEPAVVEAFEALGSDGLFEQPHRMGTEEWWHRFVDFWNGEGRWQSLRPAEREHFLRVGWKVSHEVRALLDDASGPQVWGQVDCPVFITVGTDSPVAERQVVQILGQHLRNGEIHEVPGGHMAPLTHARAWLRVARRWLDV